MSGVVREVTRKSGEKVMDVVAIILTLALAAGAAIALVIIIGAILIL